MTTSIERTMPKSTQRAHFDPSWRGDRLAAIRAVSKRRPGPDGIRAIDMNFQWAWHYPANHKLGGNARNVHWSQPGQNLYFFILEPGAKRARRMTRAERRRPISGWPDEAVSRWRRTPSAKSAHPMAYEEAARHAVALHVTITAELKSMSFAKPIAAEDVVAAAKRQGHPPLFMALYGSMPDCQGKCKAIVEAGGFFAVIFGRYRRRYRGRFAQSVKRWPVPPTRVW